MATLEKWITIRGARTHNLRSLTLQIPRNCLTVITGPSGSGKSSLAFDTIYAEGRRRFLDTLRGDKRALFRQLQRPDVDAIDGLPPVVCVSQNTVAARPRSTLATVTEIHDHLRLLYARFATPYCPDCNVPIYKHTLGEIVNATLAQDGRKIMILAPLVVDEPGDHKAHFQRIRQAGFLRARVDGVLTEIRDNPPLDPKQKHTVELIVDRLLVKPNIAERLRESLGIAVEHSGGRIVVSDIDTDDWRDDVYCTQYDCPRCRRTMPVLEPSDFNFNQPRGACPSCTGFGQVWQFDPKLLIPEMTWTLQRVIERLAELTPEGLTVDAKPFGPLLDAFAPLDAKTPFADWPSDAFAALLNGTDKTQPAFPGLLVMLRHWSEIALGDDEAGDLLTLCGYVTCPDCDGARLNINVRSVRFHDKGLHQITTMTVDAAVAWFATIMQKPKGEVLRTLGIPAVRSTSPLGFAPARARAVLLAEIGQRLTFLRDVGLGYLTLDRPAPTLSGGEAQRARLATHLGGGLIGVCYILDEPTMGLHPRDTENLLAALRALQARGNTVIVVEHDATVIRAADYRIDIGPGAGKAGGQLIACGPVNSASSACGLALGSSHASAKPQAENTDWLTIRGARHHNLKNIDAAIPLGYWTCLTGVSGSGKSSLARDVLCHAIRRNLGLLAPTPGTHDRIDGIDQIERLLEVDQKPLGRSSRSNPASYTGLFDEMRKLYASTRVAKLRGWKANRFSFNVKGGRCDDCLGQGQARVASTLMPELRLVCPTCQGKRFNAATLEARWRGLSIADALELSVADARQIYANVPTMAPMLHALDEVGLGYVALGQPANTLSGGEAQRVKLATEIGKKSLGKTLYLLDEPTTGLHFVDVARLVHVFRRLTAAGNTVVVIEHHPDLIAAADWVIDLGPGAGEAGGEIIIAGTPTDVARCERSVTGRYLGR